MTSLGDGERMTSNSDDSRKEGEKTYRRAYTPSNITFLCIPEESLIDYGIFESGFLKNLNRIYGILAALSEPVQNHSPEFAYSLVNAALQRFWTFHHSDITIPFWSEECCWRIAHRYWA